MENHMRNKTERHVIEVEKLVKLYDRAKEPAVKGIDLTVNKGEFFAFLGPNGAGKTTTISILTTTLARTSGKVLIAGYDVERESKSVRENIGIIFQQPSLDPLLTAEENIRFHACLYGMYAYRPSFKLMPKAYRQRVMDLAEIVEITDALFKPIKKLSGGMQRKLEIIRSLIHTPKVLFLDEPTQGLDAASRRSLWKYIDEVRLENGTTVFLTTHYIDEAEGTDKVCIINHGDIVARGTPSELKQSLLKRELLVDADNRSELISELCALGLYDGGAENLANSATVASAAAGSAAAVTAEPSRNVSTGPIVVPTGARTPQEIIHSIRTKLTRLEIHEPTLEDAYIEYLKKTGGEAA